MGSHPLGFQLDSYVEMATGFPLTSDQLALQLRARELAQAHVAPTARDTDATEQYPWDNVARLRDAGFMGMTLPTDRKSTRLNSSHT